MCKFHGWVYDNAGQLVSVPDEANFFDLDKDDLALRPIAVDVWRGMIFVNLDPKPAQSLREYLCGIDERLDGFPFDKLSLGYAYKGNLNCNWKIAVDSQQEAYHAVHLHRRTQADILTTRKPVSAPVGYQPVRSASHAVDTGQPQRRGATLCRCRAESWLGVQRKR